MADSENSRTLPPNTYRNPLPNAESFLAAMASGQAGGDIADMGHSLARWSAWRAAHRKCMSLCSLQQRLESELFRTATGPRVELCLSNRTQPAIATTLEEIDALLPGDVFGEMRARAKAELSTRRLEWDAADELIGHSRARAAEDLASATEQRLAEELFSTSADSVIAVMAKLHCVVEQGEPEPDSQEFPWPQIRSVLADLVMLSTRAEPISREH